MIIIIANIIGLVDDLAFIIGSKSKNVKKCMLIQASGTPFSAISNILLGSYSGAFMNLLAGFRNILKAYNISHKWIFYGIAVIQILIGTMINKIGIIGLLPVIASSSLTISMLKIKSKKSLDKILFINISLWFIHDLLILNFVSVIIRIFALVGIITNKEQLK